MDVAVARRVERPGWLNLRTVLGGVLFGIAFFSGWQVIAAADAGYRVWAAGADLPSGTRLRGADLQLVEVGLAPEQLAHYVSGNVRLEGATLLQPVRAGHLLASTWVADADLAGTWRVITIPIAADHAVGGALRRGDRVDVFASVDAGRRGARTTLLVGGAEIEDLVRAGGLVMGEDSLAGVTVRVSPEDAARLAFAIRTAEIDVARVEGEGTETSLAPIRGTDL